MSGLLERLFNWSSDDQRVLRMVGPHFLVITASSVIVASFTKALFLSENELSILPWMFLGSSTFTVIASSLYVIAMINKLSEQNHQSGNSATQLSLPKSPSAIFGMKWFLRK